MAGSSGISTACAACRGGVRAAGRCSRFTLDASARDVMMLKFEAGLESARSQRSEMRSEERVGRVSLDSKGKLMHPGFAEEWAKQGTRQERLGLSAGGLQERPIDFSITKGKKQDAGKTYLAEGGGEDAALKEISNWFSRVDLYLKADGSGWKRVRARERGAAYI
ncbi:hypothetical protein NDU88_002956 [Pleurodeles waltl]|uniref:Uncharacterized protein n=1 Tax=Pleurodeles waltl TaxID=8319 RepID=A0AAV7SEN4_PLEWA|nr:hypothetical protein NDU88_002956 [Pleurodeles waltl]